MSFILAKPGSNPKFLGTFSSVKEAAHYMGENALIGFYVVPLEMVKGETALRVVLQNGLTPEQNGEIIAWANMNLQHLIASQTKIQFIKALRSQFQYIGLGLKEAKDIADYMF